jgi:hypothetical protein
VVIALAAAIAVLPPLVEAADPASWLYRALVLLVIACPCALVISTPVSIVSALSAAARHGVLVKGGGTSSAWRAPRRGVRQDGNADVGLLSVRDIVPVGIAARWKCCGWRQRWKPARSIRLHRR